MICRRRLVLGAPAVLSACAGLPRGEVLDASGTEPWQEVRLPGKRPTRYGRARLEGREVVHARAEASASMWRRRVHVLPQHIGGVRWAWRVDRLNPQASISDPEREDAVARVLFAFEGDVATLSARTQAQFELARALTGERPPYATLMYVWETRKPEGLLVTNPRTDRVRKIVVDSGHTHLGRWREHRRDLAADFRLAFGEDPGALIGIALMTDADNTRSQAEAWYGPVQLEPVA